MYLSSSAAVNESGSIVLPGPALQGLVEAGHLDGASNTILALWRSPERLAGSAPWHGDAALVDVTSFGEIGLLASLRGPDGIPVPIPYGNIGAPRAVAGVATEIEVLRTGAGMFALRGPMVPAHAFPPGAEHGSEPYLTMDAFGFVDTGFVRRLERDSQALVIGGLPGGMTSIGGYRFRRNEVDAEVAAVDPGATIVALPDAFLDQRLAGSSPQRAVTAAELAARGSNPLIAGALAWRGECRA